jgi:rhodanese/phosphatase family RapZ-like protein
MALVIVGGASPEHIERALSAFQAEGFAALRWEKAEPGREDGDAVFGLPEESAPALRDADRRGLRYVLVHNGPDDGEPEGSYARAHHRVEASDLPELARRLRGRSRMEVNCLAFAFKNGLPPESGWVVDARCLDNPYWVPELKPLDGRDPKVRDYVLRQPAAACLLDGLEATLAPLLAEYRSRGRMELTVAFGCTGGRHRSVVLAQEMARRLKALPELDVVFRARDLED